MKTPFIATALAALLAAGSAQAVTLTATTGPATVTAYSSGSLLSFDLDFASLGATTLTFAVEAADIGGTASFNALVRNLTFTGVPGVTLTLAGTTFSAPGSIATDGFQAISASGSSATGAWATFTPAWTTDLYFGAPHGTGTDWTISLANAQVGDTFSLTVAVPEPESYALMLAGLAAVGAVARRKRRNG